MKKFEIKKNYDKKIKEYMLIEGTNKFKIEKISNAFKDSKISMEGLNEQNFIIDNLKVELDLLEEVS